MPVPINRCNSLPSTVGTSQTKVMQSNVSKISYIINYIQLKIAFLKKTSYKLVLGNYKPLSILKDDDKYLKIAHLKKRLSQKLLS